MRFWELKEKEVINCRDGKRLGYIADLDIDLSCGKITRLFIPSSGKFCGCFGKGPEIVVFWNQIVRIGEDIVIVDIETRQPKRKTT